jgi:TrmH family RNA methyltransferase
MTHSLQSLIRHLQQRKGRERRGLTLAEGVRLVEEAVSAGVAIRAALIAPALEATPRGARLATTLRARAERLEEVSDRALAALAATEHPQGVIAVVDTPRWRLDDLTPRRAVLVLDAVQDPGNVGTMLRTAWALGADGAIALPGSADLANPKVLRAAMGASFRLPAPFVHIKEAVAWIEQRGAVLWVATPGGEPVGTTRPARPVALVVGNEGAGVRPELMAIAQRRVAIPLRTGVESLNVGVAAGILLYEVLREP